MNKVVMLQRCRVARGQQCSFHSPRSHSLQFSPEPLTQHHLLRKPSWCLVASWLHWASRLEGQWFIITRIFPSPGMSLPFLPARCWPALLSKGLQVFDPLICILHNTVFDPGYPLYSKGGILVGNDHGIHWSYHILHKLESVGLMEWWENLLKVIMPPLRHHITSKSIAII